MRVRRCPGQLLFPPLPRRDGIRVGPEPPFRGAGLPFELRERRVGRRLEKASHNLASRDVTYLIFTPDCAILTPNEEGVTRRVGLLSWAF